MKKPNREQMDDFVAKMDGVRKKVDEGAQQKVMPLIRGYEGVIIVVLAVIILASLSAKALMLGALVAAIMLLPVYYPRIMARLQAKPETDVTVVVTEAKVEDEQKKTEVIVVEEDKTNKQ